MKTSDVLCWICCILTPLLFLSLATGMFYLAKEDSFDFNTRGYITSTFNCSLVNEGEDTTYYTGTIDVSFYPIGEESGPLVNMSIGIPEICTDFYSPCCSKWRGKLIYLFVYYSNLTDSYWVGDISGNPVQYFDDFIGVGVVSVVVAVCSISGFVFWFLHRRKNAQLVYTPLND